MRVVAGRLKGRPLVPPKHDGVRPTSDRVREAVFNILCHGIDEFELPGSRVLDLFAGTGALGIEALSRGADRAVFVESDAAARAVIQANIAAFGLGGIATIFRRSALDLGPAGAKDRGGINLVFADPPYRQGLAEQALKSAADDGWLCDGAVVVIEEAADAEVALPAGFQLLSGRQYGGTQVIFAIYGNGTEGQQSPG